MFSTSDAQGDFRRVFLGGLSCGIVSAVLGGQGLPAPLLTILNGIVSHEDWLPTFAAAAGAPDIKEKLLTGVELNGRTTRTTWMVTTRWM